MSFEAIKPMPADAVTMIGLEEPEVAQRESESLVLAYAAEAKLSDETSDQIPTDEPFGSTGIPDLAIILDASTVVEGAVLKESPATVSGIFDASLTASRTELIAVSEIAAAELEEPGFSVTEPEVLVASASTIIKAAMLMETLAGEVDVPYESRESESAVRNDDGVAVVLANTHHVPSTTSNFVAPADCAHAIDLLEDVPELPTYRPLRPVPAVREPRFRPQARRTAETRLNSLDFRVRLVFRARGTVAAITLVPERKDGMPTELFVAGTLGELALSDLTDKFFADVTPGDLSRALGGGVNMRGKTATHRRFRWALRGREVYVLAPGDDCGLSGYVSIPRLLLGEDHVVLATKAYEDDVWKALEVAGCEPPEVWDDSAAGVPHGWQLFRGVKPMHAVPARNEAHLLNALCPLADVAPHFIGGIRLQTRTWLMGYPPRICFTGERGDNFRIMIDGQNAKPAADGSFQAPGWDSVGEHRLWFGGQSVAYSLRTAEESWDCWSAHDFGTGAAICGASINPLNNQRWHQIRVPSTNPLLIGAIPGQVFCCRQRDAVRCGTLLALVPFEPVWALPIDPIHCDKRSSRVVMLRAMEPGGNKEDFLGNRSAGRAVAKWIAAIRDAGRKQLQLAEESDNSGILWQRYRALAKEVSRRTR